MKKIKQVLIKILWIFELMIFIWIILCQVIYCYVKYYFTGKFQLTKLPPQWLTNWMDTVDRRMYY